MREREKKTSVDDRPLSKLTSKKKHRNSSADARLKSQFGCCHRVLSYLRASLDGPALAEFQEIG